MNKSEKFLNVSDEIPNTSKEITQWRKDNKIEGSIIKVWACNGKILSHNQKRANWFALIQQHLAKEG